MFTSNIGRGRFFVCSAVILVVEITLVVGCIFATMGLAGLANSKPGSSREGLALAIFIVTMITAIARSNIAWRRSRDANLPKWMPGGYIVFSICFAVLQALTVLVYKFDGDNSNFGLSLLGFAILGLWGTLQGAATAAGGPDPDAFVQGQGPASLNPGAGERPAAPQSPSRARPMHAGNAGPARGFGKRGLV